MTFSAPTNPVSVWQNATRTLTGGGGAFTTNGYIGTNTLANGTTVTLATFVGSMRLYTIVGAPLANVIFNFGLSDGVTFRQGTSGASATPTMQNIVSTSNGGAAINNSGTAVGTYAVSFLQWNS